jgi:hypothetical protein
MFGDDDRTLSDIFFGIPALGSRAYEGRTKAEREKERAALRRIVKRRYYASKRAARRRNR